MMIGGGTGSAIASLVFLWAMVKQFFPYQLEAHLGTLFSKLVGFFYPYIEITFAEYSGERLRRSDAYAAVESYLGASSSDRAKRLKADIGENTTSVVLSMDDYEEVVDVFKGVKVWWSSNKIISNSTSFSIFPAPADRRFYRLTFHRAHRIIINDEYIKFLMEEGNAIAVRKRQRKLFTNNPSFDSYEFRSNMWSHVAFEHPATFDTLALSPETKDEIVEDLLSFRDSKEYYKRIGKPWKRGYLLYGPPGTGKSTMIAAMANLLDYDVYDLELTAVKDNSTLRKLLIETSGKSIIVFEDIDCSLDLTGKRKEGGDGVGGDSSKDDEEKKKDMLRGFAKEESKVTLSGLLNFIDGLWSACGGERLIIFTTNHVEKLDPALIRRGRMDKHIELSYCSFYAFLVLAKNYLGVESHRLFDDVKELIAEVKITPADVAETLIIKRGGGDTKSIDERKVVACLEDLIGVLRERKAKSDNEGASTTLETKEEHHESNCKE